MKKFEEFVKEPANWDSFLEYKLSGEHLSSGEEAALTHYIKNRLYLKDVDEFLNKTPFPNPVLKILNKHNSIKKRTVFTFSETKNLFLKFMSFYLMDYDSAFAGNLCSFRKNICAKTAIKRLTSIPEISKKYCYKVDISDYFASVDIGILLPRLHSVLTGDERLFDFIKKLLSNPYAEKDGETVKAKKGIMAGVPISAFLANLYLSEMDCYFEKNDIIYIRYSDDIIVFADSLNELNTHRAHIIDFLEKNNLSVNRKKEMFSSPGDKWEFLGFSYCNGIVDISEVSVAKMKKKMKRKARALVRWKDRKNADNNRAVRAFIKAFNKKLFTGADDNSITWSKWYFPVINTSKSLHIIDLYMQDCIRYVAHGNYSKSRYNLHYDDMKKMGYTSLVNQFYKFKNKINSL